jgi:hypothetical protein
MDYVLICLISYGCGVLMGYVECRNDRKRARGIARDGADRFWT